MVSGVVNWFLNKGHQHVVCRERKPRSPPNTTISAPYTTALRQYRVDGSSVAGAGWTLREFVNADEKRTRGSKYYITVFCENSQNTFKVKMHVR